MPERNVVSWTAMVAGYANSGEVSTAREIFDEMLEKNAVSWTAVIVGYGKCGDVRGTRQVFDEICVPDATSWAAMIACYAQNGFSSEAIEMYWKMRSINEKANEVAVMGVMSACTQLGGPFFLLLDFSSCHPFFFPFCNEERGFWCLYYKVTIFWSPLESFLYVYLEEWERAHDFRVTGV
ncbi:hypothetical protein AAC387_Pa02g0535 [Persea americana]